MSRWRHLFGSPRRAITGYGPLDSSAAAEVARLQGSGGFARGWSIPECEALLADRSVMADGAVMPRALGGAVLSRVAGDEAEILVIAVDPRLRGAGIGGALLRVHLHALEVARVRRVFLEVDAANGPALALYRRQGFTEAGFRRAYYPKPDGTRADALIMRRDMV